MEKGIGKYVDKLEGITYLEWEKLKHVIDRSFEIQIGELKKSFKLADGEKVKKLSQKLFG